jgi:uncharacterized YccA/Bax inhibitor family protein
MIRTANPTLSDQTFGKYARARAVEETMTIQGTVNRTGILLALAVISASWTWGMVADGNPLVGLLMPAGVIAGLIFAIVTVFKPTWAHITGPIYALAQGLFLGGISGLLEAQYSGIAFQAVFCTFGTLLAMLLVYKSGLIPVTQNFRLGLAAATGGIFFLYLGMWIFSLFGVNAGISFLWSNAPLSIGFSVVVVIIASLNLVLDFDFIERGAERGAPKYLEWYGAFALMVTLVWLYIEILRLLAKLRR